MAVIFYVLQQQGCNGNKISVVENIYFLVIHGKFLEQKLPYKQSINLKLFKKIFLNWKPMSPKINNGENHINECTRLAGKLVE